MLSQHGLLLVWSRSCIVLVLFLNLVFVLLLSQSSSLSGLGHVLCLVFFPQYNVLFMVLDQYCLFHNHDLSLPFQYQFLFLCRSWHKSLSRSWKCFNLVGFSFGLHLGLLISLGLVLVLILVMVLVLFLLLFVLDFDLVFL